MPTISNHPDGATEASGLKNRLASSQRARDAQTTVEVGRPAGAEMQNGAAGPLPALVMRYLAGAVPRDSVRPRQVRITQIGEMWLKPGAPARRFTATERFAVDSVAFSWRARFPLIPAVAIRVVDEYDGGVGRLTARVLGFPIVRAAGPETAAGEAIRYLAELPLVPHAIAHNHELEWRELGERSVEVATRIGAKRLAVTFEFDAAGDIARASCATRPRLVGKTSVQTPWACDFSRYEVVAGIRMPTRGEVSWELPEGRFVYWCGNVTSATCLDQPFERTKLV